jgi:transcriptional antiterminator RfaH
MGYWACARLEPHRERLALHCLGLAGYETYLPRLREHRRINGRRALVTPPLFPGYAFLVIESQWHAARWSIGVINLVMNGMAPAKVPDSVIAELRGRERNGLIELTPPSSLRRGARVRILAGPFRDHLAIFSDMKPRQRIEVLLQLLGAEQKVTLKIVSRSLKIARGVLCLRARAPMVGRILSSTKF